MKMLIVLTMELDENNPGSIVEALDKIDAENLPYFAGKVHLVIDPSASKIEDWLGED